MRSARWASRGNPITAEPRSHRKDRSAVAAEGFVGQEATHRRLHSLYNAHLQKRGLVNAWEPRARTRLEQMKDVYFRHCLHHGGQRALHGDPRRLDAAQSRAVRQARSSTKDALAVAQCGGVGAQEHRFQSLQGAGRQRSVERTGSRWRQTCGSCRNVGDSNPAARSASVLGSAPLRRKKFGPAGRPTSIDPCARMAAYSAPMPTEGPAHRLLRRRRRPCEAVALKTIGRDWTGHE